MSKSNAVDRSQSDLYLRGSLRKIVRLFVHSCQMLFVAVSLLLGGGSGALAASPAEVFESKTGIDLLQVVYTESHVICAEVSVALEVFSQAQYSADHFFNAGLSKLKSNPPPCVLTPPGVATVVNDVLWVAQFNDVPFVVALVEVFVGENPTKFFGFFIGKILPAY